MYQDILEEEPAEYTIRKGKRGRSIAKTKRDDNESQYRAPSYIVQMGTGTPQWQGNIILNQWPEGMIENETFSTIVISKAERYLYFWFGLGALLAFFWLQNRKIKTLLASGAFLFTIGISSLAPSTASAEDPTPEMEKRLLERATKKE